MSGAQQNGHGWRILIAGTGGQGVLTAAHLLCDCFVEHGHEVVSGQLHGMAQRGGAVQSSVIIDGGISPVIPSGRADFVVGFEPVETARALPFMSSHTIVYMNTASVVPFVIAQQVAIKGHGIAYPDVNELGEAVQAVAPHTFRFDATKIATEAGSIQALNMVMLGCLLGSGLLSCTADAFWDSALKRVPPPSHEINTKAFLKGVEFGKEHHAGGGAL
jgi:indolepyruvate ferredoxin oxidoreductase beta subunit